MANDNSLRYLKLDFQSHKDALLQRVRDRFPNRWNDFLTNSFGVVLVDLVAFSTAIVAFVINRAAGENFVTTMTLRESAVRAGALVGYNLRNPSPAVVACEASLTTAQSADVTISEGTLVRTSDQNATAFEVLEDYTIAAGDLSPSRLVARFYPSLSGANVVNSFIQVTSGSENADVVDSSIDLSQFVEAGQTFIVEGSSVTYTIISLETAPGSSVEFTRMVLDRDYEGDSGNVNVDVYDRRIVLVQGQSITDRFVAPATDTRRYAIRLSRTPVIDGTVEVTVNGIPWTQVTPSTFQDAEDQVFVTKTLVSGQTLIVFGDDSFGAAVPAESAITVNYRVGGGISGNIGLNRINTSITGLVSNLNSPVSITLTNATSTGTGGRAQESLEEARNFIPVFARTNDRAVTLTDYQILAQTFTSNLGSVAYARSTVRRENALLEGNMVAIYAWTTGASGGLVNLSSPLKEALRSNLQSKAIGTDLVSIFDGSSRPVPIAFRFLTLSGFDISTVTQNLDNTLTDFVNARVPGETIFFSDLMRTLDEETGVDTVEMATPLGNLVPSNSTELFTAPQDTFVYEIERTGFGSPVIDANGDSISNYTAQLPVFPLQAWAFTLSLGVNEVTIVPHTVAGFARLLGENISSDDSFPSTVDLLTGEASLWLEGAPGDLTMQLVTIQGYSQRRTVDVFIGYSGENTLTKRRQIRAALRSWSNGLTIGGVMYGSRVAGISVSNVSITDVVEAVDGVDFVTRVALDSPASTVDRITSADFELLTIGNVILNNNVD